MESYSMNDILSKVYFKNTVQDYLIALAIIVGGTIVLSLFKKVILSRLKKWSDNTETQVDNFLINALEKFALPALTFVIIYIGINYLQLSDKANQVIRIAA